MTDAEKVKLIEKVEEPKLASFEMIMEARKIQEREIDILKKKARAGEELADGLKRWRVGLGCDPMVILLEKYREAVK